MHANTIYRRKNMASAVFEWNCDSESKIRYNCDYFRFGHFFMKKGGRDYILHDRNTYIPITSAKQV